MRAFAELYQSLDATTKTSAKLEALVAYLSSSSDADRAWAIYFLLGNKLKPSVPTKALRKAAIEAAQIPEWLFEETYQWVGDLAETIANIVPKAQRLEHGSLSEWIEQYCRPLSKLELSEQIALLNQCWGRLDAQQRFVFNKLLTGNLRVGVNARLVTKAISEWSGIDVDVIAHRLTGEWRPTFEALNQLLEQGSETASPSQPYPFCLAHSLPANFYESLDSMNFRAEWKWDGIRAQLIRRNGLIFLWSRGEELLVGRFPEIESAATALDDGVVLDGEVLAWRDHAPLPFSELQRRIQRKNVSKKLMHEVPVRFVAFDLLEHETVDIRPLPFEQRRMRLEHLLTTCYPDANQSPPTISVNHLLPAATWSELAARREEARSVRAEGLMIKRKDSRYETGRVTGAWWKWKLDPFTVDAVLIYAQRGHGRRAALYTDYTFAVWSEGSLVPFAKAYSGLTDEEIRVVDRWIRANTLQKFGPVHEVKPHWVMEIAFENVQLSTRHKSGVAVRFPRIVRIREDKKIEDADRLQSILELVAARQG
jgi:DNA ligase-1